MADTNPPDPDETTGIERVLRTVGPRARPPENMKEAVRAAVRAEWRTVVAERSRRRRHVRMAMAAAVVIAALGLWTVPMLLTSPGPLVASVAGIDGGSVQTSSGAWSRWHAVQPDQPLHAGDELRTGSNARAALALPQGISLRLDRNSRIVFEDPNRVVVEQGALYVDSGTSGEPVGRLRVETPAGAVQHLGTQYEVRLVQPGVRISVREGRVRIEQPGGSAEQASAGQQLTVTAAGVIERGTLPPHDSYWDWASSVAPAFDIDGRSLPDFLAWAARELGREVIFASPESAAAAENVTLNGSVAGLTPEEALAAVLPTTRLQSIERNGDLVIELHH